MSIGGGASKSNSSSKPWYATQPYLKDLYRRGSQVTQDPSNFGAYPGQRVADESGYTQDYRQELAQRVGEGDPTLAAAQSYNRDVLAGNQLNANPYTSGALSADLTDIRRSYMEGVNQASSGFEASGRSAGGMRARAMNEANRTYAQEAQHAFDRRSNVNYQQERGYQEAAASRSPGLAAAGYSELGQLGTIGEAQTAYDQRALDDLVAKYEYYQRLPMERLSMQSQLLGTSPVMQSGSSSKSWNFNICHGAAVYFDWYTPDWWCAARWINDDWPEASEQGIRFRDWYRGRSEQFAEWIRGDEEMREAFRPFFEWCRDMGRAKCTRSAG